MGAGKSRSETKYYGMSDSIEERITQTYDEDNDYFRFLGVNESMSEEYLSSAEDYEDFDEYQHLLDRGNVGLALSDFKNLSSKEKSELLLMSDTIRMFENVFSRNSGAFSRSETRFENTYLDSSFFYSKPFTPEMSGMSAAYAITNVGDKAIYIFGEAFSSSRENKGWSADMGTPLAMIAHEYGHHVNNLLSSRRPISYGIKSNKDNQEKRDRFYYFSGSMENGPVKPKPGQYGYGFTPISQYGGTSPAESFAESFTAYTMGISPKHGTKYHSEFKEFMKDTGLTFFEGILVNR